MKKLNEGFVGMVEAMKALEGGRALDPLLESLRRDQPSVGMRVNVSKGAEIPPETRRVPWNGNGFYYDGERPRFTFDPALHQGLYYVQDPSSMAVGHIIRQITSGSGPVVYIDACAAPGGKATAAIDALPSGSIVIANEWDRHRAEILKENIIKWGYPATVVSRGGTAAFRSLKGIADIISVDAPCSGEGMMRKDDEAVSQWSEGLVQSCAAIQRDILSDLWEALRPGGCLIYSTCTFNRLENELNVQWMIDELGAENPPAPLPGGIGIAQAIGSPVNACRFIPGRIDGEGLFIALLRKPGSDVSKPLYNGGEKKQTAKNTPPAQIAKWIRPGGMALVCGSCSVSAFPAMWLQLLQMIRKKLDIIYSGVEIAQLKGRDYIPSQSLALSLELNTEAFPRVDVSYADAIAYLQRLAVTLPAGTPRGFVLLTYCGRPLGFVKNLGNRANNLYPASWAIRSTHAPSSPPAILEP